jgi:hypothetical protein
MDDKKTTITGVITGALTILAWYNLVIPADFVPAIVAAGVAVIGYFAKDK